MNQQSTVKMFFHYVSRSVLSMLGLSCYILADTYFIANGVGAMAVAALNLVLPLYSLISGTGILLGMGAATRYSILKGEGQDKEASVCFTHALLLGIAVGILYTIVGVCFAENLAGFLGAEKEVLAHAKVYLTTISAFSCFFIVNQILVCFVRNDHAPGLAMLAMLTGSFSNVILDYVFVFPMGLSMFGAAFATGLAPLFSIAVLSWHYFKKCQGFHLVKCSPCPALSGRIVALGMPSFITEASSGVTMAVFNVLILGISGSIGVAAYGIIANIALVVVAVFTGIAQGIQPIVSMNIGLRQEENNKTVLVYALVLSVTLGCLFYGAGKVFAPQITALFNKEQNETLALLATNGIGLYFPAFVIMGINIVVAAFLAASAKPLPSLIVSSTRGFIAPVAFALLLAPFLQMKGVWLAIPAAEATALLFSFLFTAMKKRFPFFP